MGAGERTLEASAAPLDSLDVDVVAVTVGRGAGLEGTARAVDGWLEGRLSRCLEDGSFRAEDDEALFFAASGDRPHVVAVGVGERERGAPGTIRRAAGRAVRETRRRRASSLAFLDAGPALEAAAQGVTLGDWTFEELLGEKAREERGPPPSRAVLHLGERAAPGEPPREAAEAVRRGRRVAASQNFARELVARPANVATPSYLASRAEEMAGEAGLGVQVWGPEKLREQGFGGLLAVARGSTEEPRFIVLRHEGADEPPCVLVGKGVTFDSGGISLKPSEGMQEMKYDMAGGAAVLGAMRAAARLDLPRRVIGLVPATENLPSGSALKPGDVIRGVSGTSIEVVNTDAEGRLILSDALAYAGKLSPAAVVDLATLTGACVVALGHHAMGLMAPGDGPADALADALLAAGRRSGERAWRLPLWSEYRKQLESDIADIKNSGGRPAGAVTAGVFLGEFVDGYPWAHLDIAGVAWAEEEGPCQPEGATGAGVRLLVEWLRSID